MDIQTTVNHILGDYIRYFNFYGADMTGDELVNVLDLTAQVNAIQSGRSSSRTTQETSITKNKEAKELVTENLASLSIENGELILDPNGHSITSFEILLDGATEETIEELTSDLGFSTSLKENENQLNIVAFSFGEALDGKVALANIGDSNIAIASALLSNKEAKEVPYEIIGEILSVTTPDIVEDELVRKARNYPNPVSYTHLTLPTIYSV